MLIRIAVALWVCSASTLAQSVIEGDGAGETVYASGQIIVAPAGIEVQSGGSFTMTGTNSSTPAKFQGPTAGVGISVLSGGTIDLYLANLENITTLTIASGAYLTLLDTVFSDLSGLNPGTTSWIDLSACTSSDRSNIPFSLNRVTFSDPQSTPTRNNVKASSTTPIVRMLGNSTSHGNRWGESYDDDTSNRILWNTGSITRTSPSGTFDTVEDAIKDTGTTASSVLTCTLGAGGFIQDRVDFDWNSNSSSSGPTIKGLSCNGNMRDSDSGTAARGVFVNCVLTGKVEETTVVNCTLYKPGTGVVWLKNVTAVNTLVENGFSDQGGNTLTDHCLTNVTDSFFSDPANFDLHLIVPGGSAAVDAGGSQSSYTTVDFEGESRPQGSSWDIGADEVAKPTFTTGTHTTWDTKPNLKAQGIVGSTIAFFRWVSGAWSYLGNAVVQSDGYAYYEEASALGDGAYIYGAAYYYGTGSYGAISALTPTVTINNTQPVAPTNIRTTSYSSCIDVEWDASTSTNVSGYLVYRQVDGTGSYDLCQDLDTPNNKMVLNLKFRDTHVSSGHTYKYQVKTVNNIPGQ